MKLHPDVITQTQTCSACPEQWEGTLKDGRTFYFRYRHGQVRLGVGADHNAAWNNSLLHSTALLKMSDGMFDSMEQAQKYFAILYGEIKAVER